MKDFDFEKIMAECKAKEQLRAVTMPDEETALKQMFDAYLRLKELGFNDAMYCPKDGSRFEVIEAGSTGIHKECHYQGDWPKGTFWIADHGDLWPSHPILFRKLKSKVESE